MLPSGPVRPASPTSGTGTPRLTNATRAGKEKSCSLVRQETFRTEVEARPALTSDIVGYYVASDVQSPEAVPNFRASIMDGYAVVGTHGEGRPGGRRSQLAHCLALFVYPAAPIARSRGRAGRVSGD